MTKQQKHVETILAMGQQKQRPPRIIRMMTQYHNEIDAMARLWKHPKTFEDCLKKSPAMKRHFNKAQKLAQKLDALGEGFYVTTGIA